MCVRGTERGAAHPGGAEERRGSKPSPPRHPKLAGGFSLPSALSQPYPPRRTAAFHPPPLHGQHDPATYRDIAVCSGKGRSHPNPDVSAQLSLPGHPGSMGSRGLWPVRGRSRSAAAPRRPSLAPASAAAAVPRVGRVSDAF